MVQSCSGCGKYEIDAEPDDKKTRWSKCSACGKTYYCSVEVKFFYPSASTKSNRRFVGLVHSMLTLHTFAIAARSANVKTGKLITRKNVLRFKRTTLTP